MNICTLWDPNGEVQVHASDVVTWHGSGSILCHAVWNSRKSSAIGCGFEVPRASQMNEDVGTDSLDNRSWCLWASFDSREGTARIVQVHRSPAPGPRSCGRTNRTPDIAEDKPPRCWYMVPTMYQHGTAFSDAATFTEAGDCERERDTVFQRNSRRKLDKGHNDRIVVFFVLV